MPEMSPPRSWFDRLWPRLATASGVGYVTTAYAVSCWLTRRSPAVLQCPDESMEALQCRTADGVLLKGWHIAPPMPRGTVALFHGMRLNRAHMLERVALLTAAGYRCIAFDHRAHGESGGRFTSFGYYEGIDVAAVLDVIRRRWPNEPRAALGVSMGAAALCFSGDAALGFDALILESLYSDLSLAFEHRVGRGYPAWFQHFRNGIIWFTERRLGARVKQISPLAQVARFRALPTLFVTGEDDPHAPHDEVALLAAQVPGSGQFHAIPGAGHTNVCSAGGSLYRNLLLDFLDETLGARRLSSAA